jgi:hypothetical protein
MDIPEKRFEDLKVAIRKQKYFGKDGLYFCGFCISPTGLIYSIGCEARKIAKDIAKKAKALIKEMHYDNIGPINKT